MTTLSMYYSFFYSLTLNKYSMLEHIIKTALMFGCIGAFLKFIKQTINNNQSNNNTDGECN